MMISYHSCPLASQEGYKTGGMELYVLELSRALARLGHSVDMYTRCQAKDNPTIVNVSPGLRLIHLPAGPAGPVPKKQLYQYLDEFAANVNAFVSQNVLDYDLVHAHYYLSGLVARKILEHFIHPMPIVMSFHTLGLLKNLVARDELEKEEYTRIAAEKSLIASAAKIVAVSEMDSRYLSSLYGAPLEKLIVIPPGVNPELFRPIPQGVARKKLGIANGKLILFVGRTEPLKGADLLIYALKILIVQNPNLSVCLLLVGGEVAGNRALWSRYLRSLDDLGDSLGISSNVRFIGQQPQYELPYYYNAADMVVMPSHYESFGMVALEAMSCGVPVVMTDTTGISSLLDEKHQSLITSVNNPFLLAQQMEKLLLDEDTHRKISAGVRAQVSDLSWEAIAKQMENVYLGVV